LLRSASIRRSGTKATRSGRAQTVEPRYSRGRPAQSASMPWMAAASIGSSAAGSRRRLRALRTASPRFSLARRDDATQCERVAVGVQKLAVKSLKALPILMTISMVRANSGGEDRWGQRHARTSILCSELPAVISSHQRRHKQINASSGIIMRKCRSLRQASNNGMKARALVERVRGTAQACAARQLHSAPLATRRGSTIRSRAAAGAWPRRLRQARSASGHGDIGS